MPQSVANGPYTTPTFIFFLSWRDPIMIDAPILVDQSSSSSPRVLGNILVRRVTRSRRTTCRGLFIHVATATAAGGFYAGEGNSSPGSSPSPCYNNTVVSGNWTACSLACSPACKWSMWRVLVLISVFDKLCATCRSTTTVEPSSWLIQTNSVRKLLSLSLRVR